MPLKEVYENENISHIEEKFALVHLDDDKATRPGLHVYQGKYPLEPFISGARGTYGGEFITQGLLAAWEAVDDPTMSPHSFHSYFVKAGSMDSPIRWEVQEVNNGRNYANRLVLGYQSHTNKLVFTLQASFVKNNSAQARYELTNETKLGLQRRPHSTFYEYKDRLSELNYFEHTHGLIQHIIPSDFLEPEYNIRFDERGNSLFGFFVRINDNLASAKNPLKTKIAELTYLSDSFYLGTLAKALGLPLVGHSVPTINFFRVSLDHTIHFHDTDFDPTEWMYLDYRFSRLNNDRVLCQCQIFTLQGKMVASFTQEGLVFFEKPLVESIEDFATRKQVEQVESAKL